MQWFVASFAALAALGLSAGKVGKGSMLESSMNRQNIDPNPPKGPAAIGMNA